jgi:hypothetical protein
MTARINAHDLPEARSSAHRPRAVFLNESYI